jgi:hypothetical protein
MSQSSTTGLSPVSIYIIFYKDYTLLKCGFIFFNTSFMRRQQMIIIVAFLVLIAGFLVFSRIYQSASVDVRKFTGNVLGVEGQTIALHGVYAAFGPLPPKLQEPRDFYMQADETTIFKKTEVRWPSWDVLTADGQTSGIIYLNDLPKIQSEGSLADIQALAASNPNSVIVEADFARPIPNAKNPTAATISYEIIVESDE